MKISVGSFKGTIPLVQPRLLTSNYAQMSTNVKYTSGSIVPYNACASVQTLADTTPVKTIYKFATSSTASRWLTFTNRAFLTNDPIFADSNNRTVISGLDVPRIFDIATLSTGTTITSANSYVLGLVSPAQPTMAVSGSSGGTPESRAYTIQYDRTWSDGKIDAGPWSLPAKTSGGALTVDVHPGNTVVISDIADAPNGYGITNITINRTASSSTNTAYQFVFTFNIASAKAGSVAGVTWNGTTHKFTYTDAVLTTNLGSVAYNQDYIAPPTAADGLISLNNGILAMYDDNYIYFSEPYQCHAWPDKYKIAIDRTIVGLGSFGSTLVVCTNAEPQLVTVSDPAAAIAVAVKEIAPCVSSDAIVSFRDAVVYPSYEGFIRIDSAGITNMTQSIASSSDIASFAVDNMSAVGLDSSYYGVFTDANNQKKILVINMASPDFGFGMIDTAVDCAYVDRTESTIYVAYNPSPTVYCIGSIDKEPVPLKFTWKSKVFTSDDTTINLSAGRIQFAFKETAAPTTISSTSYAIDKNSYNFGAINGFATNATGNSYIVFKLYADGELVFQKNVQDNKPFRMPAGYTASEFEFELSGYLPVYGVDLASAMTELSSQGGQS